MFTRQEVCALADTPVERFKSWVRRNELPTAYAPISGVLDNAPKDSGWNRYSALEVFLIAVQEALFRQIGEFSGIAADTASWIVAMNARTARDVLASSLTATEDDRWIGYAGALRDDTSSKEKSVYSNVSGTLDDVLKSLQKGGDRHVRLLLVNADAVLRGVQARAKKNLKIDFVASARIELMEQSK
jgi:hypothetical protein